MTILQILKLDTGSNLDIEQYASLSPLGFHDYIVSTYGRVFNHSLGKELKGYIDNGGYKRVTIKASDKSKYTRTIHRLVGLTFLPKMEQGDMTIDHIDRNKLNNNINNLRWATKSEQAYNRQRKKTKARAVLQYDISGVFIKEWQSAEDVSLTLNIPKSTIRYCCNKNKPSIGNFLWKYKIEAFNEIKAVNLPDYEEIFATDTGCIIGKSGYPKYGSNLDGYLSIAIKRKSDEKYCIKLVHRLVALAFIGPDNGLIVNHKNGIKTDNRPENLEYVTFQENVVHAFSIRLIKRQCKSVIRICPVTGKITGYYESTAKAGMENNIGGGNITNVCKGVRNTSGGHRWAYADDPKWTEELITFRANMKDNTQLKIENSYTTQSIVPIKQNNFLSLNIIR